MAKGFVVDLKKCVGCKACVAVCKIRYGSPEGVSRRRVFTKDTASTRIFVSMACHHCAAPACVPACPKGALAKSAAGLVMYDATKCVGCRRCEWSCPYDSIEFVPSTKKVDKCDACATKVDGPRCVESCHAKALSWVDVDGAFTAESKRIVVGTEQVIPGPELTNPNVRFVKFPW